MFRLSTTLLVSCVLVACSSEPTEEALIARGDYLVNGIVACGNCHTPRNPDATAVADMRLAGSFVIEEPVFRAYAPNITQDHETGIGSWSDAEIMRAIREGVRPDGTIIGPPMPILSYRKMSDSDVQAIVAYLRTVAPIKNIVPRSEYDIPLPESWGPPPGSVPDVNRDDSLAYGTYLGDGLGHCMECHTPMVDGAFDFSRTGAGGFIFNKPLGLELAAVSANITPHPELGIGDWTDDEIKTAITRGVSRDGRKLAPVMAFPYYQNISDEDLDALIVYLRSLPPQPAD
ncbi:MAG: cytochrome c [Gammaproteobacteria bacterium]|nr:cytochrome c [Gammaproteobacteria bacterium]